MKSAQIQAIYLSSSAGEPMEEVHAVKALAGIGLANDRYARGIGAYSNVMPEKVRHISLIALSGIETANDWLKAGEEPTFNGAETRRNIVLADITASELNNLVGQHFRLGDIQLLGTELCAPCERPAQLLQRPSFMEAFEGRGGIRAEILNSGTLATGDKLFLEDKK